MKVAIIQEHVDVGRGGAETSTVEMARHLAALGLDVALVCRGDSDAPFVDHNVTFWPLVVSGATRAMRTYRFVQGATRLCRAESFDIVHAVTPCLSANVYQPRGGTYGETITRSLAMNPLPLRWLKRIGRRFNIRQRFLFRVERLLLKKHGRRIVVAALSDYVRRQVRAAGDLPPERVRVVFNGVDFQPLSAEELTQARAERRAALGIAAGTPLLLFVAHNFKLKGLAELLRALVTADADSRWEVVVAGRDRVQPYEHLAHRLGVAQRVHFVGADRPVRHWYAAADVLAHPTWYDPCSRVVLEALCGGLPVVTTRYNGAAEVMETGRHGEVVGEPNDTASLVAALSRTLQPAVRAACQADAERMRGQLAMARHARELAALYEDVLAGR